MTLMEYMSDNEVMSNSNMTSVNLNDLSMIEFELIGSSLPVTYQISDFLFSGTNLSESNY